MIDSPLTNLIKIRREKNPNISKSEMKKEDNNKHHGYPGNHQRLL
jgi:hypothetical protein